jgi:hypothetical protein
MSEFFLRRSYFDPAHDNPLTFLLGHSFGVFQYFFGQLAIGDLMALFFLVGVLLLLRRKSPSPKRNSSRRFAIFLLLPFAIAAAASLAHVYPYGGTRHIAFLIIPAMAGVSVAMARLSAERPARSLAITLCVLIVCIAIGKPRRPTMDRADQSQARMSSAVEFVARNIDPSALIFTDYESDLVLGHYLCSQRPIAFETSNADFEVFSCGHKIISAGYKAGTDFTQTNFPALWNTLIATYGMRSGTEVWVMQAGWDADLPEKLRDNYPEFRALRYTSFGDNIRIFKLSVGQPVPTPPHL